LDSFAADLFIEKRIHNVLAVAEIRVLQPLKGVGQIN
jgi:hypothetical protein